MVITSIMQVMYVQTHVIHTHTCISFNTTVVVGVSETLT